MMYMIILIVLLILVNAMLIVTPWLMPKTECFAVTVPLGERDKEPLAGFMRRYARWMILCAIAVVLIWLIALQVVPFDLSPEEQNGMFTVLVAMVATVPIVISFALMLYYRKRVQEVKAERGWKASHPQTTAYVGPEEFPKPLSVLWNLLYIPLIAAMTIIAFALYDQFPDVIPMNVNVNGVVSTYVPKSTGVLLFPAALTAFMGLIMACCHAGIIHSKKPIDPSAPASSALAYGRFARIQSIALVVGGLLLSATIGTTFFASALGVASLEVMGTVVLVVTCVFAIAVIAMSVKLGQSGARVAAQPGKSDAGEGEGGLGRDDDKYWLLGVFYFNREEPSVFVPKRFGIGWTINLAQPLTWVFVVIFTLVIIGFSFGITALLS